MVERRLDVAPNSQEINVSQVISVTKSAREILPDV